MRSLDGIKSVVGAHAIHIMFGWPEVEQYVSRRNKWTTVRLLRHFGAKVGAGCDIESPLRLHNSLSDFSNLIVGARCHVGKGVLLDLTSRVTLEDECTVSMDTIILTHIDVGNSPLMDLYPRESSPVTVCSGAYIGAACILTPGVRIGSKSLVGAGSVVTRDVEAHVVAAGVPARRLRPIGPRGPNA